jgi:hypothetical protein
MATSTNNRRTPEEVRREIEAERDQLASSVDHLRAEIGEATDIGAKIRSKLPVVAAGALGAGFLIAGGIGATMRLLARRGREGTTKARFGRFSFVDRD